MTSSVTKARSTFLAGKCNSLFYKVNRISSRKCGISELRVRTPLRVTSPPPIIIGCSGTFGPRGKRTEPSLGTGHLADQKKPLDAGISSAPRTQNYHSILCPLMKNADTRLDEGGMANQANGKGMCARDGRANHPTPENGDD